MRMRQKLVHFMLLVFLIGATIILVGSSVQTLRADETPRYSNNPPGEQGERTNQAVQCGGGGWVIVPGCCYGNDNCDDMNPCKGAAFSCNGRDWVTLNDKINDLNP